jgi:hypothetical protein
VAGPNGSNATQLRNMLVAWKNLRNSKCDATLLLEKKKKEYSFLFLFRTGQKRIFFCLYKLGIWL